MIAFRHEQEQRIFDVCRQHAVDVGSIGSVRVDPHGFNNAEDIDQFLACLDLVHVRG